MLSREHTLLNREAAVAAELIGSGATLLSRANYARPGSYGQAFFNLSIGLERAAKLIYIADHAINNSGSFPTNDQLRRLGHNLNRLLEYAEVVATRRRQVMDYAERPATAIHNGIVETLAEFALQTRYYNLDSITGASEARKGVDPLAAWNDRVMGPILDLHCSPARRAKIEANAMIVEAMIGEHSSIMHTDEGGDALDSIRASSRRTGEALIVQKWAPFYVLQIARWLGFTLYDLSLVGAYQHRVQALLGLQEHFGMFLNSDKFFRGRRTWSLYSS